jgi:hypothetical protein
MQSSLRCERVAILQAATLAGGASTVSRRSPYSCSRPPSIFAQRRGAELSIRSGGQPCRTTFGGLLRALALPFALIHPPSGIRLLGSSQLLRRLLSLRTHHHNRAVGVTHDRVRDTSHQSPSDATQAPAAHDDETCSYVLSNLHDLVGAVPFGHPQVLLSDFPSGLLDLLRLIFEYLLSSLAEVFDDCRVANVVGRIAGRDGYDV